MAVALVAGLAGCAARATPPVETAVRLELSETAWLMAKITAPAGCERTGKRPAVVLVPGSMPSDVDHTVPGRYQGRTLTTTGEPMLLWPPFVERLLARDLVVVRYGKRGVSRTLEEVDAALYQTTSIAAEVADTRAVLARARAHPCVDGARIGLLGWSEGTLIAPRVAEREPGVRALVLIGVVGTSFEQFLVDILPSEPEARALIEEIENMPDATMLGADRPAIRVKELLRDGANAARIAALGIPVFVAHGALDVETPVAQAAVVAAALADAGSRDYRVQVYPVLGHILSSVPPGGDARPYGVPAAEPLDDIARWLEQRLRSAPAADR